MSKKHQTQSKQSCLLSYHELSGDMVQLVKYLLQLQTLLNPSTTFFFLTNWNKTKLCTTSKLFSLIHYLSLQQAESPIVFLDAEKAFV